MPTIQQFVTGLAKGIYSQAHQRQIADGFLARDTRYSQYVLGLLIAVSTDTWSDADREATETILGDPEAAYGLIFG